jgi:hypothetical protein
MGFAEDLNAMHARREQDRLDAARYRWLRSFDAVGELLGFPWTCGDGTRYLDEYRDADIDDAMARAPGVRDTDGGGHG